MKDERLYMTFPIDMPRHPKFARLSVEAKWAFVEMNGEARIADNDGIFAVEEAEFLWPVEVLDELVKSHPSRPLVVREGDTYRLREFAKHQQTKAEREELRAKRAEAGRKGGLAKGQASAKRALSRTEQTQAQSESELLLTDRTTSRSQVTEVVARANESDEGIEALRLKAIIAAEQWGLPEARLPEVRDFLERATGRTFNLGEAVELAGHVISRSKAYGHGQLPDDPDRYVIGVCRKSPGRVSEWAAALDLGEVAS